ncbi:MAG: hypothetical protein CVV23_16115 [Ignavibacteriae bacterium HGW-Ignavibacteriae-2]|jgi:hypothetical protein|nr:DUF2007 domain-containing protein [Bacteroidota bacterium]PKL87293.1 MAG: hypothetical protein CVV23_16115 [Ignavibacteriae bacterium HGW-Ignavibacteriae-2]
MICPNCEYEFIEGITECPDCNIDLISLDDFEGNVVHHKDWVVVFTTSDIIEAEMMKSNLEGADIEALILSQKDRSLPGVGDLSIIKLLVKKIESNDAILIINDINQTNRE